MEGYVRRTNIERYRKMLANPRDDAQRLVILKLLAEEEVKLKEHPSHQASHPPSPEAYLISCRAQCCVRLSGNLLRRTALLLHNSVSSGR